MVGKKYLLDTHCLLWFQENNPKIPKRVMQEIQNPENLILFSQLSLYEIVIKQAIGKLPDLLRFFKILKRTVKVAAVFMQSSEA